MLPPSAGICAAAHGDAAHRRLVVHRPGDLVDAMNGLLDQAVAAEPHEVVPVAQSATRYRSCPAGRLAGRRHRLHRARVVGGVVGHHVADRAAVHLVERLADHSCYSASRSPPPGTDSSPSPSCAVASTERMPGASVAIGFSQNMCLPALTHAARCCGRNPGGVASSTDVHAAVDHLLERIQAQELVRRSTFDLLREHLLQRSRELSIFPWNTSATAVSSV